MTKKIKKEHNTIINKVNLTALGRELLLESDIEINKLKNKAHQKKQRIISVRRSGSLYIGEILKQLAIPEPIQHKIVGRKPFTKNLNIAPPDLKNFLINQTKMNLPLCFKHRDKTPTNLLEYVIFCGGIVKAIRRTKSLLRIGIDFIEETGEKFYVDKLLLVLKNIKSACNPNNLELKSSSLPYCALYWRSVADSDFSMNFYNKQKRILNSEDYCIEHYKNKKLYEEDKANLKKYVYYNKGIQINKALEYYSHMYLISHPKNSYLNYISAQEIMKLEEYWPANWLDFSQRITQYIIIQYPKAAFHIKHIKPDINLGWLNWLNKIRISFELPNLSDDTKWLNKLNKKVDIKRYNKNKQ